MSIYLGKERGMRNKTSAFSASSVVKKVLGVGVKNLGVSVLSYLVAERERKNEPTPLVPGVKAAFGDEVVDKE
jgi:hypothetical protein